MLQQKKSDTKSPKKAGSKRKATKKESPSKRSKTADSDNDTADENAEYEVNISIYLCLISTNFFQESNNLFYFLSQKSPETV